MNLKNVLEIKKCISIWINRQIPAILIEFKKFLENIVQSLKFNTNVLCTTDQIQRLCFNLYNSFIEKCI